MARRTGLIVTGFLLMAGVAVVRGGRAPAPKAPEDESARQRNHVDVPSLRSGTIALVGRSPRYGEFIPQSRQVLAADSPNGVTYFQLLEGDFARKGELLARLDTRQALRDLELARSNVEAEEAALHATIATREEAKERYERMRRFWCGSREDLEGTKR